MNIFLTPASLLRRHVVGAAARLAGRSLASPLHGRVVPLADLYTTAGRTPPK